MTKKIIIGVVAGLVLIVAGAVADHFYFAKPFPDTTIRSGDVSTISGILYAAGGGVRQGGFLGTSTAATTYTLATSDVANIQTLALTPTVGTLTLTLPNFNVLASFVPNIGDEENFEIFNGTTTSGQNITLVKTVSGGVNVTNASSSLTILPQGLEYVEIIRTSNSTTTVQLSPSI